MKTTISMILCICLVASLQSCVFNSFNAVKGNKNILIEEVAISEYNKIDFGGSAQITYEQKADAEPYLKIEIDENLFPLLQINTDNNTLSISSKENLHPSRYVIYTNSKELAEIYGRGSTNIYLKGTLQTENLKINLSGSGKIQADNITCNNLNTSTSGSGNIKVAGKANEISSSVSGSGKIDALEMESNIVRCSVSGSGNFDVNAMQELDVKISGSGTIKYKGEPTIKKSIAGSGKILKY
ncbi:MAG: DUF2807 domain-containing protein [Prevotella sp.]|jgi:hypothetical protein|nr:DUF2807 domain-containing protein [Prevotella sp.]